MYRMRSYVLRENRGQASLQRDLGDEVIKIEDRSRSRKVKEASLVPAAV